MKKRRALADRGFSRKSRTQSRPTLERFEDRMLLTIFTVTNTNDSTQATAGDGSLRGEIMASNASTTALPNNIVFALPSGLNTITLAAPLPTIVEPVVVDGSSATSGLNGPPEIDINGTGAAAGTAITVDSAGVVIQDLIIDDISGDAIDLDTIGSDTVTGCYIGVSPTGSALAANAGTGILVASPNNQIGNTSNLTLSTSPNVISGNSEGIEITGTGDNANDVTNNYVGTNSTGTTNLGNSNYGISVTTSNNTIGGVSGFGGLGGGNLVSGNLAGIQISTASAAHNLVEGNYIGTTLSGNQPLRNTNDGLDIANASNNSIGGLTSNKANVISGNGGNGVEISGSSILNVLEGNHIGVGSNATTAVGNSETGVLINGAKENIIGGTTGLGYSPQYGNIIENNGTGSTSFYGVEVLGGSNDAILSNTIYENGGLGIKLNQANAGVTPPTLTLSESGAGQTEITGTYAGDPNEPYLIQFFSNQNQNASGSGDGQNYLGDLNITTDSSGNATFSTILDQPVPVGDYVSATATDDAGVINNTSEFSVNTQNVQAPVTDLALATTLPSNQPLYNQPYTFTFTVTNNGPDADTGVVLTDVLPTNSTFVSATVNTVAQSVFPSNGVLSLDLGDLASDAADTVTITVTPGASGDTFDNSATVTGDGLDPNNSNNSSSTSATILADADLAVLITPGESPSPVGSPLTYVLTVSNFGPSVANGTVAEFQLPSSFTDLTVVPDQGSYTTATDTTNPDLTDVTIDIGLLGVSQSSTITISGTPQDSGTGVTTDASVSSSVDDPNTSNNTATSTVDIENAADLSIGLTASPTTATEGQDLFYTVTVTNNGPNPATDAIVTDTLPSGVTFDSANSSTGLSISNGVVTADLSASPLLAGASENLTIALIPTVSTPITNTVSVADANEIDTDPTNNSASLTTLVSPADIGVVINNPSDPLFIGDQAVYQVTVTNNGPTDATNVILTDTFGSGATIVSTSAGSISGSVVTANLGTIPDGESTTVDIAVNPTVSGILNDSASITSDNYDPNPNDNTTSSTNLVSPVDLAVAVTPSETSLLIGQPLTFSITVTNNGPATATNVLFSDTVPASSPVDSYVTSQGTLSSTGTVISGNLGSLASGASATITIVVTPTTVESAVNTSTVTSDDYDTDTTNNTVTTTVNAFNQPGAVQFASALEIVPENSGSVTLTLTRTDGTLGAVSVNYATSDYTAVAGVNYVASSGTVSFADGQTTATITIPVLDDEIVDGVHGFFVTLTSNLQTGGGVTIGTGDVTGVLVTNTDRDTIPPAVIGLIGLPNGNSLNGFVVTFDKAMAPGPLADLTNYHLYSVAANGVETPIAIAGVVNDAPANAVTIIPAAPLPANHFYRVLLNGSVGDALTDLSGNVLAGAGVEFSNYDIIYGQGTKLTYDDALGNAVTIKISNGGTLGIYLNPNGSAEAINLYQVVPGHTKLTGSVKKLSKHASGYTTIGFINGFGEFGDVFSTLTTPSFYVGSAPVGIDSIAASSSNNTTNVLTIKSSTVKTTISTKAATPKGPKVKLA